MATAVRNLRRTLIVVGLMGCQGSPAKSVDLQLDVRSSLPSAASAVRVCVMDGVSTRFAAASGNYAVTGLSVDVVHTVTVDVMDASDTVIASTSGILLNYPYNDASLEMCEGVSCTPCTTSGSIPVEGDWTHTLGVRFLP